jgi:hypothetical protein
VNTSFKLISIIFDFENKTKTLNADELEPVAVESLVELLVRLGRCEEAITVLSERLLGKHESLGIAPPPLEIVKTPESLKRLRDFYEADDDLLGFAVCVLKGGLIETPDDI